MKSFFRFHVAGLLLSILIGAIIAAPPIIFHYSKDYQGVEMMKTNTETHYLAQVQELYDGHYGLGNPYLSPDTKNESYLFPPLGVYLTFGLGKLLGLSAIHAVMMLRFFFISLLSFFVYYFTFQLTKHRIAGLVAAPFVLLGYSIVDPMHIISVLRGNGWSIEKTFIDYGRPVTPQVTSLFFFAYLIVFWRALHEEQKRFRNYAVIAALILGASFYLYLFTWTFIFSLHGFLVLVYACQKEWGKVKRIVGISLGALVIGIPYLLHTYNISQHPWYQEVAPRFGFVKSRTPNISRLVLGAAVLFALSYRKLSRETRLFFIAFLTTAIFVVNEQVITGQFVFNHHYHWYYNTPLVIILLVVIGFQVLSKYPLIARRCALLSTLVFLGYGVTVQTASYRAVYTDVIDEQRYVPLFTWLNQSSQKDTTVFVSLPMAHMIPAATHANVYYSSNALYTLVPTERLLDAYLVYAFLEGVTREGIEEYLEVNRDDISGFAYGYAYRFQKGICTGCFPDEVIAGLARNYQHFSEQSFLAELKKYPVDYVVWDTKNDPAWRVDHLGLEFVKSFDDIHVYRIP